MKVNINCIIRVGCDILKSSFKGVTEGFMVHLQYHCVYRFFLITEDFILL